MKTKYVIGLLIVFAIIIVVTMSIVFCSKPGEIQKQARGPNGVCYVYSHHPMAGFFSVLTTILTAATVCKQYELRMIVILDDGPYLETNNKFIKQYRIEKIRKNWFDYYFEQSYYTMPADKEKLIPLSSVIQNTLPIEDGDYIFDSPALVHTPMTLAQYANEWSKSIIIRPHVTKLVQAFDFKRADYWIGVHYRGTDKYNGPQGNYEHDAIHYDYHFVTGAIDKWIEDRGHTTRKVGLFIASDEQPFVDNCIKHWSQYTVFATDSIRAQVSTSGINPSGQACDTNEESADCKLYKNLTQTSIHLGMKELSSYKKGQDVLLDVILLSKCNVFFRSQGNVSDFPKRINPEIEEIFLNQLWKDEIKENK